MARLAVDYLTSPAKKWPRQDLHVDWWSNRIEHWRKGRQPKNATLVTDRKRAAAGPRDVYVYFDNDAKVHAPFNARTLTEKLKLQGAAI